MFKLSRDLLSEPDDGPPAPARPPLVLSGRAAVPEDEQVLARLRPDDIVARELPQLRGQGLLGLHDGDQPDQDVEAVAPAEDVGERARGPVRPEGRVVGLGPVREEDLDAAVAATALFPGGPSVSVVEDGMV